MTAQDYLSLSQTSLSIYFENFLPIFVNIVAAALAVGVGVLIGWILKRIVEEISNALGIERALSNLSFYSRITKSHEEMDVTGYVGEAARWSSIVVFLISAVASLQIEGADVVFSQIFAYITSAVLAALYLLFGFVIAWFVHRALMALGTLVGTVPSHLIANVSYTAIIIFAAIQALLQLGVTSELLRLIIVAGFAASALAFGLAGKDTASDWIKKFASKANR